MSNYTKAIMQELRQMGRDLVSKEEKTEEEYVRRAVDRKIRLHEAQMADLDEKQNKRDSKPRTTKRRLSDVAFEGIIMSAGVTAGAVSFLIADHMNSDLAPFIAAAGLCAGAAAGDIGCLTFHHKPISNTIYRIATKSNRKKYEKLKKLNDHYRKYIEYHYGSMQKEQAEDNMEM